jgi:hypothetical protein
MNILQLRQTLEQLLGYYTYTRSSGGAWQRQLNTTAPGFYWQGNKKVSPAFYVQGRQRVPTTWDAKGLEAVLVEKPRTRVWGNLGSLERHQHWTLYLQQYDSTQDVSTYELMILRHFGGDAQSTYWKKEDVDLTDRVMITIKTIDFDLVTYPVDAQAGRAVPSPVENSAYPSFFDQ